MKKRVIGMAVVGLAGLVGSSALAAAPSAYLRPGHTELESVGSGGSAATYPGKAYADPGCGASDMTPDGRFVVFESGARNLVAGSQNPDTTACQVFWRDRRAGVTQLVSVGVAGTPAAGGTSGEPHVSADGRLVVFSSTATNLVPGDTNASQDIFVRDVRSGQTRRVSVTSAGAQGTLGGSRDPDISADGRFVAFVSTASNLIGGSTMEVLRHDLRTGSTVRVSVGPTGAASNGYAAHPALSGNGRFVSFLSSATNLVGSSGGSGLGTEQVYRRDVTAGKTLMVSSASDGSPASYAAVPSCSVTEASPITLPAGLLPPVNAPSMCYSGSFNNAISLDGRFVTFQSTATNLVPNDTNVGVGDSTNGGDVFVKDMNTGRVERVSVTSAGGQKPDFSGLPSISPDGRTVAYETKEQTTTCVPGVTEILVDSCARLFVGYTYDRLTGSMELVAPAIDGSKARAGSCFGGLSPVGSVPFAVGAGGRYVSFLSGYTNIVSSDTNNHCDIFVRDRGAALGVGGLTGAPSTTSLPPGCGLPVCPPIPSRAGLEQARVIPRPSLEDLFIRWDVNRMAPVSSAPTGGLLYELRFTTGGQQYAVRAQRIAGADFDSAGGASFGLFRETLPGVWTHVASLKGGYGTVGDAVVTAVPLSLLGGEAQLTDVTAYTAVGSYISGPTKVLDSLRLSR